MNDPSNGGTETNPARIREKMGQWREQARTERKEYEPRIRQQIQSQFQEYSPAWYASLIGHTREKNLLVVQSRLSGFAATLGREFENEEVKALAEHSLETIDTNAACKWGTIGLAGYMTYRGRHTWQFPFYRPKLGGRFNPHEATSLFSNKKIRGVYPNLIWHTMRFTAYVAVTLILVEPMFRATNHLLTEQRIMKDPRLERFTKDVNARVEQMMGRIGPFGPRGQSEEEQRHKAEDDGGFSESQQEWQEPEKTAPSPYRWKQAAQPARPAPQTERNDDWSVLDDDDASPVAASAPSSSMSGSAWDRLRQQSHTSPQQTQSNAQSGWGSVSQPRPQQQSQGGWGESASSRESYSYNSPDEGKSGAREQAQAEFDRLLEQERRGVDQERSWGRR